MFMSYEIRDGSSLAPSLAAPAPPFSAGGQPDVSGKDVFLHVSALERAGGRRGADVLVVPDGRPDPYAGGYDLGGGAVLGAAASAAEPLPTGGSNAAWIIPVIGLLSRPGGAMAAGSEPSLLTPGAFFGSRRRGRIGGRAHLRRQPELALRLRS